MKGIKSEGIIKRKGGKTKRKEKKREKERQTKHLHLKAINRKDVQEIKERRNIRIVTETSKYRKP